MDRMQVCGTCDSGSIPGGSTYAKSDLRVAFCICTTAARHLRVLCQESKGGVMPEASEQGRERHNFKEQSDYEISRLLTEFPGKQGSRTLS